MAKVSLQIYDITNSPHAKTNNVIININKVMRDGMGFGGIFHGAVEVYGEEWSYGFCERGSGVFSCPPKSNPMYTWHETIELGVTAMDEDRVTELLVELSRDWEGDQYDLLQRNCNHFCDEFSERLGSGKIPLWVNRFANFGDSATEFAFKSATQIQKIQNDIYGVGQAALSLIWGSNSEFRRDQTEPTSTDSPETEGEGGGDSGPSWNFRNKTILREGEERGAGKRADWLLEGWHEDVPQEGRSVLPNVDNVKKSKHMS